MFKRILIYVVMLVFVTTTTPYSALIQRTDNLIYDNVQDITWLKDANLPKTSGYTLTLRNGNPNGSMTWDQATKWASDLDYGGYTDWRLPDAKDLDDSGPTSGYGAYGEMGYLYYTGLGNPLYGSLEYTDPFNNIQEQGYWTATQSDYGTIFKWTFSFSNGATGYVDKKASRYAWAVLDGDVASTLGDRFISSPGNYFISSPGNYFISSE